MLPLLQVHSRNYYCYYYFHVEPGENVILGQGMEKDTKNVYLLFLLFFALIFIVFVNCCMYPLNITFYFKIWRCEQAAVLVWLEVLELEKVCVCAFTSAKRCVNCNLCPYACSIPLSLAASDKGLLKTWIPRPESTLQIPRHPPEGCPQQQCSWPQGSWVSASGPL